MLIKGSAGVSSNYEDISYAKTKFFARYIRTFRDLYQMQVSMQGGYINSFRDGLKVNDSFYLKNFKGLSNIGYYYDQNNPVKGISGENIGFNRYLTMSFKLLHLNTPLLIHGNIVPFIHANFALAPNRNFDSVR